MVLPSDPRGASVGYRIPPCSPQPRPPQTVRGQPAAQTTHRLFGASFGPHTSLGTDRPYTVCDHPRTRTTSGYISLLGPNRPHTVWDQHRVQDTYILHYGLSPLPSLVHVDIPLGSQLLWPLHPQAFPSSTQPPFSTPRVRWHARGPHPRTCQLHLASPTASRCPVHIWRRVLQCVAGWTLIQHIFSSQCANGAEVLVRTFPPGCSVRHRAVHRDSHREPRCSA